MAESRWVVPPSREAAYPVESLLVARWSPRAFTGEPVDRDELYSLFEAARWAPSSFNNQPWRFVYVLRGTPAFPELLSVLTRGNQKWAGRAAALIAVVSGTTFEHDGRPAPTHSFDTGAAWQNLALEATARGLAAHAMQGFDPEAARRVLRVPSGYVLEAMVAVGRPAAPDVLPPELRHREVPSGRKPLDEFVFEGRFRRDS